MADADCYYGDHSYAGERGGFVTSAVCSNCGYFNRQLFSYIGVRARMAKSAGVTPREWESQQQAVAEAEARPGEAT